MLIFIPYAYRSALEHVDFVSILYPCELCDCSTDNKGNSLTISCVD